MARLMRRFLKDEGGATAIEYALIVAVLSLAIVGGLSQVTNSMTGMFSNTAGAIDQSWTR